MEMNLFQSMISSFELKNARTEFDKNYIFFFSEGQWGANCASLKVHQDVCTEEEYSHLTQLHKHSEPISVTSRGKKNKFLLGFAC